MSIVFALIVIVIYGEKEYVEEPELHKDITYLSISHLPMFFGIAVFNFEGNGVILNIKASMEHPEAFHKIKRNIIIMVVCLLILFGCFSYEAFGDRIEDMVTMNLPHDNLTSTVQLLYCFGLLGSFPMQIIPAIDITEKSKLFLNSSNPFDKVNPYIKNIVSRTVIVICIGFVA